MISGPLNHPDVFDYLWKNKDHPVIDPDLTVFDVFQRFSSVPGWRDKHCSSQHLIHTVIQFLSAKLTSVQFGNVLKSSLDMNGQIVHFFSPSFRKGLMAKRWRQGHLLLKLNTEVYNSCRFWMLPFCALTMRLGALLLPRLQQEKMRLQQI